MARPGFQTSVGGMIGLVACVAVNFWLFRLGFVYGLVGLNVTKHVGVAVLCQAIGINRRPPGIPDRSAVPKPHAPIGGSP